MRAGPRRVETHYSGGERTAHSKTVKAAIRAAFSRLLVGEYSYAYVLDEYGVMTATLSRTPTGVRVTILDWRKV